MVEIDVSSHRVSPTMPFYLRGLDGMRTTGLITPAKSLHPTSQDDNRAVVWVQVLDRDDPAVSISGTSISTIPSLFPIGVITGRRMGAVTSPVTGYGGGVSRIDLEVLATTRGTTPTSRGYLSGGVSTGVNGGEVTHRSLDEVPIREPPKRLGSLGLGGNRLV